MSSVGQYQNSSSLDGNGLHITDTQGYSAHVGPDATIKIVDRNGHQLNLSPSEASVSYSSGNSSISVNSNRQVVMNTSAGPGSITTISQIRPDGSLSLSSVSIKGTAIQIGNKLLSVEVGAELKWSADSGLGFGYGGEIQIVGQSITDIADFFYAAVESSSVGELLVSRDEWMEAFVIGETTDSHLEWFRKRNQKGIDSDVNTDFLGALNFVQRYDPLVLDLDGDGIETVSANSGVVFDFNGDGLKTGTGWIKKDDGFLVLDRNGNSTIDNGSELFGVDTIKNNGQKATSGFDALSDLDANGDGVFDAADKAFADVRVWQDLNQDGIAQAGELKGLTEHGIAAINLGSKSTSEASNGNLITAVGSFVRNDGSEGVINGNQSLVANLDLASNPFYREYSNTNPAAAGSSLPKLKGSGAVRDLRDAAVSNSGLSSALSAYSQAQTREQQLALVDKLIAEWASTSSHRNLFQRIDDMELGRIPIEFSYSWDVPHKEFASSSSGGGGGGSLGSIAIGEGADFEKGPTAMQLAKKQLLERVSILEIFNGQNFFNFSTKEKKDQQGNVVSDDIEFVAGTSTTNKSRPRGSSGATIPTKIYLTEEDLIFSQGQIDLINQSYEKLRQSIYEGLLLQTRLKPYADEVTFGISQAGLHLDYSGITRRLLDTAAVNPLKAIIDSFELRLAIPAGLDHAVIGGMAESWLAQLSPAQLQSLSSQLGGAVIQDGDTAGDLHGTVGSDLIFGKDGNDTVYGGNGNDFISGGGGSDVLHGGEGRDLLLGGEGSDELYGGAGDDTLEGGAGNDYLSGGAGSDVYRFSRGWGQDTINNYDAGTGKTDAIEFAADLSPSDIIVSRSSSDLILSLKGSSDRVTVSSYFSSDGTSPYKVEEIRFANGTTWSIEQVKTMVLTGTDGSDTLTGFGTADLLDGGAGNDYLLGEGGDDTVKGGAGNDALYGGNGNDLLQGGEGSDELYGDAGDDTLEGGAGNDYLSGGAGSDVYRFSRGWGQDTINNYDAGTGKTDAIEFAADLSPSDIIVSRSSSDLILSLKGSSDRVTVSSYFSSDGTSPYKVEEIRFANGTTWSIEQVKTMVLTGTDGSDTLTGFGTADLLDGGAGNDYLLGEGGDDTVKGGAGNDALYGGNGNDLLQGGEGSDELYGDAGDDTLEGGAGNDYLSGGAGSDVYRFSRGWGQDTINNYDAGTGKTDAIEFAADLSPSDIIVSRSSSDLILSLKGSSDRVTVSSYFSSDGTSPYKVEEIRFANGTTWSIEQVKTMVLTGTDGSDTLTGFGTADLLDGGAGNDYLLGEGGDDTVKGGAGNDALYGGNGNDLLQGGEGSDELYGDAGDDTLEGGAGNDYLSGGAGSDVYRFSRGWGQDTINNYDAGTGKTDAIEFAADLSPSDIIVSRSSSDLILSLKGSSDRVTVSSYFSSDGTSPYKVEEIRFANGTTWSIEQVKTMVLTGTDGSDTLTGFGTADLLDGGAGNDYLLGEGGDDTVKGGAGNDALYGGNGNDLLQGGEGSDELYGDAGDDTLEGGAGNDYLSGGAGSDVYRFSRGWGQDTINNYDAGTGKTDAIEFAADLSPSDIIVSRSSSDLILSLKGSSDRVTVSSYFSSDGTSPYKVEEIRFANGTTWSIEQVKTMVLTGTDGSDTLTGFGTADLLDGGAGNDYLLGEGGDDTVKGGAGNDALYGGNGNDLLQGGEGSDELYGDAGDDTLEGGAGNDYLSGGAGSDVYRFSRGWGQDTINNYDAGTGKTDAIEFAADLSPSDIIVSRSSSDLILSLKGSSDRVTVSSYFSSDGTSPYKVEEIRFANGTTWSIEQVKTMVLTGTDGSDTLTGFGTADLLDGGAGNDYLLGEGGDDTVKGGAGNDALYGGNGNDLLQGGEGSDELYGDAGDDTLEGGAGNDYLSGGAGSDVYRFSRGWGQDTINNYDAGTGKTDAIEFAADLSPSDIIVSRSSSDLILSLKGSSDRVTVSSYFSSDGTSPYKVEEIRFANGTTWSIEQVKTMVLTGTDGSDTLTGFGTADLLDGGAGNDYLLGEGGDDTVKGGAGNDALYGGNGNDLLQGGEGSDELYGDAGDDTLEGGAGNDYLSGGAGSDVYRFSRGWGQDTINNYDAGTGKTDAIEFAADLSPSDIIVSRSSSDLILSLKGSSDRVTVSSYFSSDGTSPYKVEEIRFANGTTWSIEQVKTMVLTGTDGSDTLTGFGTADLLDGGAGNDYLLGEGGDDTVKGGAGNDALYGGNGNDLLQGGEGSDELYGDAGDDTLEGGAGNDYLSGGAGSDVYRFSRGWGQDTINNYDAGTGKTDAIEFAADLSPSDIIVSRSSSDLILSLKGSSDRVTVSSYFSSDGTSPYKVEEIRFANGTTWSIEQVKTMVLTGTDGSDTLTGFGTADLLDGGAGNDYLLGEGGDDTVKGGAGNDALYGGNGNDLLQGGEGSDELYGDAGDDTLEGGAGNDYLSGGAGSDVYRFSRGWGQDTINNYDAGTGKTDAIEFAADLSPSDIIVSRSSSDLILSLKGSSDRVTVSSYFSSDGTSPYKVEEIRFANGTTWSIEQVKTMVLTGTDGSDTLTGFGTADLLDGGAGNDYLLGEGGDDTVKGGAGNDALYGGNGNDLLQGGEGSDELYGDAGDDTLEGGAGNDYLSGGAGSDVYRFSRGWGQDTINNYDAGTGKTDAIEFAADLSPSDIIVSRSSSDLILSLKGSSDRVTVSSYFSSDGTSPYKVEEIRFANGTTWSIEQVKTMVLTGTDGSDTLTGFGTADLLDGGAGNDYLLGEGGDDTVKGGAGNDALYGGNGNDLLQGGEGSDELYGDAGDDTLEGGAGNDYLSGGAGSDVYRFSRGWGQDTINNYDAGTGKTDAIEFAADLSPSDIIVSRSSSDLILSLKGSSDRVTVSSYFSSDGTSPYKVEEIRFANGTTWSIEQVKTMVLTGTDGSDTLTGFGTADLLDGGAGNDYLLGEGGDDTVKGGAGNDALYGGNGNDLLQGGEGSDELYGDAGDDTLEGGAGNDYLSGGAGSDVYRFSRGWGQDTINNYDAGTGKTDAIEFAADLSPSDIIVSRSSSDLILSLKGSSDRVTVSSYFSSDGTSPYKVEEIRFANGTTWSIEQVKTMVLTGTDGSDTLTGFGTADLLDGGAGNDYLLGEGGDDTVKDGAGNDALYGGNGNDLLQGGEGSDELYGDAGDDTLEGGAGNDYLSGGAGNDTLRGGSGNDTLNGGGGNDTYIFGNGDGRDVINKLSATAGVETDILRFEGIDRDSLWLSRQGSNLVIDVLGAEDRITVQSWYTNSNQQLDIIQAGSSSLYANQVDNLVNAMAAFGAPAGGEINLTQAQRDQLNVAIAANWQ